MRQEIEFYSMDKQTVPVMRDDVFSLNEKKKMVWLQKICIWVLRKLKCNWYEPTVKVTRHRIEANSFVERLFKQRQDLLEYFGKDATTLLIGSSDYAEMMCSPEVMQAFSFSATYGHGSRRICGLEVKVVPWMTGMVVLP